MLVSTAPYWLIIVIWGAQGVGLQLVPMPNNDVCDEAKAIIRAESYMKAYCIKGE